jgi:hypothetical protein
MIMHDIIEILILLLLAIYAISNIFYEYVHQFAKLLFHYWKNNLL